MTIFASTTLPAGLDGLPYATLARLPGAEASLFNAPLPLVDPVPLPYEQAIFAVVQFQVSGALSANTAYVVLQTDLGDGVWIDVAWCLTSITSGTATFVLSGGVAGANSFQQSRAVGTAPAANGQNQCPLGGRIRFVGKAATTANTSSSSSSGAFIGLLVTIKYKLLGLR